MASNFQIFQKKFPYLDIEECITYYSIFNGHPNLSQMRFSKNLQTLIEDEILDKLDDLKNYFIYDKDEKKQILLEKILIRLAIGDRKSYTVYDKENLSQIRGRELYKQLFEHKIIKKEKSREKPIRESQKQLIKKSLRRYKIQDKIQFCDNFTRFWFTFIAKKLNDYEKISFQEIEPFLEKYISLEFENLSNEFIIQKYKNQEILSSGSYWDKDIEIDILTETKKQKIAGEVKWKNSKICKNILNNLQNKCKKADLQIDKFVLFSKSGYSKELKSKKHANIDFYELKDFETLYL